MIVHISAGQPRCRAQAMNAAVKNAARKKAAMASSLPIQLGSFLTISAGDDEAAGHVGDKEPEQRNKGEAVHIAGDKAEKRRHDPGGLFIGAADLSHGRLRLSSPMSESAVRIIFAQV
ncbi:MAG: hypothetical protein WCD75_03975 [Rhodoplanes sp.]